MSAPISYCHSPFMYHHVPSSPFLPARRLQAQSPIPMVPDIDNVSGNRNRVLSNLGLSARETVKTLPIVANRSVPSPVPLVPSVSAPSTPTWHKPTPNHKRISLSPKREQVVPNLSPLQNKNSMSRERRRLDMSPSETAAPEIELFSGDEIFA